LVPSELNPQNTISQAALKYQFEPGVLLTIKRAHLFTLTQHFVAVKPRIYDALGTAFPKLLGARHAA
jgi:hypothetical protein